MNMKQLSDYVISIPDFPEEGIIFRDVTGILKHPDGLRMSIDGLLDLVKDLDFDAVAAPESRGFIFGMPVAYEMKKAFIPIRKKGKLPRETASASYALEYGTAEIEVHKEDIVPGAKYLVIDDLLATGGTCEAIAGLIESLGGIVVKMCFVIELAGLNGRAELAKYNPDSLIIYEGK